MIKFIINEAEVNAQFAKFIAVLGKNIVDGAKEVTSLAANILQQEIVQTIRNETAVASGSLLKSITVGSMQSSSEGAEINVGSSSPYASFVEHGRKAGKMPPVDKIYEWMSKKGIEPDRRGAFLIARKIGRDGIPAKNIFSKAAAVANLKINAPINALMDKKLEGI